MVPWILFFFFHDRFPGILFCWLRWHGPTAANGQAAHRLATSVFFTHMPSWFVHGPLDLLAEGWNWNWMNCAKWYKKEVGRELWIKLYLAAVSCNFIYSTAIFAMFIKLFLDIIYVITCYTKYKLGLCDTGVTRMSPALFNRFEQSHFRWTLQQHIIEIQVAIFQSDFPTKTGPISVHERNERKTKIGRHFMDTNFSQISFLSLAAGPLNLHWV